MRIVSCATTTMATTEQKIQMKRKFEFKMIFAATMRTTLNRKKVNLWHPFAKMRERLWEISLSLFLPLESWRTHSPSTPAVQSSLSLFAAAASAASFTPKMKKINHIPDFIFREMVAWLAGWGGRLLHILRLYSIVKRLAFCACEIVTHLILLLSFRFASIPQFPIDFDFDHFYAGISNRNSRLETNLLIQISI